MSNLHRYDTALSNLLRCLKVVGLPTPDSPCGNRFVNPTWGTSVDHSSIHLKLVSPFREMPYTFMLAHMEEGAVRETALDETVILQCIAGQFRMTDEHGNSQIVQAPGHVTIEKGVLYIYEALKEVYNIMQVNLGPVCE